MQRQNARKQDYGAVSRRGFLMVGVAGAALALTRLRSDEDTPATTNDPSATESDIEGPFYRADAPFTTVLRKPQMKAPALFVSGIVRGTPGGKPLKDAIVDVWHADDHGHYDNEEDAHPAGFRLRGRMKTADDGSYAFETIVPAPYKISADTFRPAHIHYKVSARGYRDLTTQLYFKGDPHLAKDRWAKKSNTMELVKHDGKDELAARKLNDAFYTCVFDIVLRREK